MHLQTKNKAKLLEAVHKLFQTRSSVVSQYPHPLQQQFCNTKNINRFDNRALIGKGPRLWNSQPPELNKIVTLKPETISQSPKDTSLQADYYTQEKMV